MLDFKEEFWAKLRQIVREEVKQALAEEKPDPWLPGKEAAKYLGLPSVEAFYYIRKAHPEVDKVSVGDAKLRRWRRSDLDGLLKLDFLSRRH